MKRAVIAVGSNSTRMLVAECGSVLTQRTTARRETKLFMDLNKDCLFSPRKIDEMVEVIRELKEQALKMGAESVDLLATSASRDAKNADELEKRVQDGTGLRMRIISGEEEAILSFRGAAGSRDAAMLDIGGGSTEYTRGKGGEILYAVSSQAGASRLLMERDITDDESAGLVLERARGLLRAAAEGMRRMEAAEVLFGVGGTCTTCASIRRGGLRAGESVDGTVITLEDARAQLRLLASLSSEERKLIPGLPETRIRHMPHGLCLLIASLELMGYHEVTVSACTNMDGYLLGMDR